MATTYYIDYDSGDDTNNGTTTGTPWKHAPGMPGCSDNCSSHSKVAGNQYILKGGIVWPLNTIGRWTLTGTWTGNSGARFKMGGDASFYDSTACQRTISAISRTSGIVKVTTTATHSYVPGEQVTISGTSGFDGTFTLTDHPYVKTSALIEPWTNTVFYYAQSGGDASEATGTVAGYCRPILDGNGARVGTPNVFIETSSADWWDIEELEFREQLEDTSAFGQNVGINTNTSQGLRVRKNHYHGWVQSGSNDTIKAFLFNTSGNGNADSYLQDNLVDGSDTTSAVADPTCSNSQTRTGHAAFGNMVAMQDNTFRHMSNGLIGAMNEMSGNFVEYICDSKAGNHENGLEVLRTLYGDSSHFDNVVRHHRAGTAFHVGIQRDTTALIYNNLVYDTASANIFNISLPTSDGCTTDTALKCEGGTPRVYNNTIECGPDSAPTSQCTTAGQTSSLNYKLAAFYATNNHLITTHADPIDCASAFAPSTCEETTNLIQSKSTANGQGYTLANYFQPTTLTDSTVNAGTDVSATCAGCTADVLEIVRPSGSGWDIGAFEWDEAPAGTGCIVSLSGSSLAFGNQVIDTTSDPQTITFQNTGDTACTITSIVDDSNQFTTSDNCGSTLASTSSCLITVTFAPTSTGAKSGTVTLTTDDPGSPDTFSLSGTGISATSRTVAKLNWLPVGR